MESTGKWVSVVTDINDRQASVRMLHRDRRGRECVRYQRQWRLVNREKGKAGYRYVVGDVA